MAATPNITGIALYPAPTAGIISEGVRQVEVGIRNSGETGRVDVSVFGKGPLTGSDPAVYTQLAPTSNFELASGASVPVPFGITVLIDPVVALVSIQARCTPATGVAERRLTVVVRS